nr:helix-turn-helix transcriptional regulator [uncultured Tolumonas sp.]
MQANQLIANAQCGQIVTRVIDMPVGFVEELHEHEWHQIIYPVRGLLQSTIDEKSFIIPHNGLLFVPAFSRHRSIAITQTEFLAIYLNPSHSVEFLSAAKSCQVTPFLKELILMLFDLDDVYSEQRLSRLLAVLNDQLTLAGSVAIPLFIPTDKRLKTIFDQLKQQPDSERTLAEWALIAGASERTLSRLLANEFKLSFSLWRQHIRLVLSLAVLDTNKSIQHIALEFGYQSDSSYIHAFKQMFKLTPRQYRKTHLFAHT